MAVTNTTSAVQYEADGVATDFPTVFRFLKAAHLVVTVTPAVGVPVVQTLGVHYAVSGEGDDAGGTVEFLAAPEDGATVDIERETPITQDINLELQGDFFPETHEEIADKGTMVDQELGRRVSALENSAASNEAVAGNGLTVGLVGGGAVWNVGAGKGIQSNADDVEVVYGAAADVADITKAAASAGVKDKAARSDHKHNVSTAAPGGIAIGDAAAEGVAASLARSDHTHSLAAPTTIATVTAAAPSLGVSAKPAREDHQHMASTAIPVAIGAANAIGGLSSLSRSDHVHAHGAQAGGALHSVATAAAHGFMSSSDKSKLDAYGSSYSAEVETTTAEETSLTAVDVSDGAVELHEVMIAAQRDDGTEGAGFMIAGTFRLSGAAAVQVGATTAIATHKDAGAAGWGADFDVSAGQVRVRVTGEAGKTIEWAANARVTRVRV